MPPVRRVRRVRLAHSRVLSSKQTAAALPSTQTAAALPAAVERSDHYLERQTARRRQTRRRRSLRRRATPAAGLAASADPTMRVANGASLESCRHRMRAAVRAPQTLRTRRRRCCSRRSLSARRCCPRIAACARAAAARAAAARQSAHQGACRKRRRKNEPTFGFGAWRAQARARELARAREVGGAAACCPRLAA